MKRFGVSSATDNFYYNYYQAEYISYLSFKRYMFGSYSTFLLRYPQLEEYIVKNCIKKSIEASSYRSKRIVHSRPMEFGWGDDITFEKFEIVYSDIYFLEKYINMRFIESGIDTFLSRQKKENIIQKVIAVFRKSGLYAATVTLSELLVYYNKSNYKLLTSEHRRAIMSGEGMDRKADKHVKNAMKSLDAWLKKIESEAKERENKILKPYHDAAKMAFTPITLNLGY